MSTSSRRQSLSVLKALGTGATGSQLFPGYSTISWEPSLQTNTTENTYQLEPSPNKEFNAKEAEMIVKQVLTSYLGSNLDEYTIQNSKVLPFVQRRFAVQSNQPLACQIANEVRQSLARELSSTDTKHGGRHKLVVHVLHEQMPPGLSSSGLTVSSCGLWNPNTDGWLQVNHRSPWGLFLILVFACYHE